MAEKTKQWTSHYTAPSQEVWEGRIDSQQPERFHQIVQCIDLSQGEKLPHDKSTFAILGFKSDEGVKRNKGRPGAYHGPTALRKALANIPFNTREACNLFDVGDISCDDGDLEEAQKQLGLAVAELHRQRSIPILFGGGHEISWGHYQGIVKAFPNSDIAIINFDAHYDLRPLSNDNLGSSGTPFMQIANSRKKEGLPFDYYCLGIQKSGNTSALFEAAKQLNVKTIFAEEFHLKSQISVQELLASIIDSKQHIYVTVCMNVFADAYAPGVSAPQPLGLNPWHVIPLLREVAQCGKIAGIDVAELAPTLDHDSRTARLAASLVSELIAHFQK